MRAFAVLDRSVDGHEFTSWSGLPPPSKAGRKRLPNFGHEQLLLLLRPTSSVAPSVSTG